MLDPKYCYAIINGIIDDNITKLHEENKMLRHELAKANKGLRHLSALKRKWENEADRFYKSYWSLRFALHLTTEERQKFQALIKCLMRHGEITLAKFVVDFQNKIEMGK